MAIGHSIAAKACSYEHIFGVTRKMTDIGQAIGGFKILGGPAEGYFLYVKTGPDICLQSPETGIRMLFMCRFMVFASGNQVFLSIYFLRAVIMVRIVHIIGK